MRNVMIFLVGVVAGVGLYKWWVKEDGSVVSCRITFEPVKASDFDELITETKEWDSATAEDFYNFEQSLDDTQPVKVATPEIDDFGITNARRIN